jgi:hypothetical protein
VSGRYCRCGSALAADNDDPLCASCQAGRRRDRAPHVPPEFWQTELMAEALASGDLGRVMRAYRHHAFHGERLPQTLVAGWLHMSQPAVCRIETGRRRLTIDEIRYIAQTLGMPLGAVLWTPRNQAGEDVEPLSRRSLLGAGAGAVFGLNATTAPAAARPIDPRLVEHWSVLMSLLDDHDASFGSHGVLPAVRRELDLIAEHRQVSGGDLRTDLLRVEARWSQFASYLEHDAGDDRAADFWADRASQLAREADYPDMIARVFVRRSQWAVARRDAPRATAFAHAARGTPGTSGHIRALCAMKAADAHALADDGDACERSLADAHAYLDGAESAQPLDLAAHEVTRHYLVAAEARCWLWLRPRKALAMYEDAVNRWPRQRTRSRAVHQARLALACVAAGEPERAASEGVEALDTARTTKSKVILRDLAQLDDRLAACDVPAAADFREQFALLRDTDPHGPSTREHNQLF